MNQKQHTPLTEKKKALFAKSFTLFSNLFHFSTNTCSTHFCKTIFFSFPPRSSPFVKIRPRRSRSQNTTVLQSRDLKTTHSITFAQEISTKASLHSKTIPGIWLESRYHERREWEQMLDESGTSPQRLVLAAPILQRPGSGIQGPFHTAILCLNSDKVLPWKPEETTRGKSRNG